MSSAPARVSLLLLMSLGLAAGCAPSASDTQPRFPHQLHLQKSGLDCRSCHGQVATSTKSEPPHFPAYSVCARCHGASAAPGQKYGYDPEATYVGSPERRHVIFSHRFHLGVTQGQCVRCHAGVQQSQAQTKLVPSMATCLDDCHRGDYEALKCTKCHQPADLPTLRPVTDIPHGVDYVPVHATDAARDQKLCQTCHAENFCTACHNTSTGLRVELRELDNVNRDFQHRGDYVSRHAIEARTSPNRCVKCHEPSTCDSCHVLNHVSANGIGARTPHPPAWVGPNPTHPDFHGRKARRQVVECAACHEQGPATNCIRCHKVGGFGGSPHPSGWRSSQSRSDAEMCQFCHTP